MFKRILVVLLVLLSFSFFTGKPGLTATEDKNEVVVWVDLEREKGKSTGLIGPQEVCDFQRQSETNKKMALIVVNTDNEKKLFEGLIDREENFDFQIDIVSLKEKKIQPKSFAIRKFLWEQKDNYDFFVLHEDLDYGFINEGNVLTDYYYAHSSDFFEYDKSGAEFFGTTVERYPELILSRIRNNQIEFYSNPKNRMDKIHALFGLPFVFFNREQPACGVGNYQIDLSYTGDFLKQKLARINPNMAFMTMYDDQSSRIPAKYMPSGMKQRKKPDLTFSSDNFAANESQNNFFLLYSTAEPLYQEEQTNIYNECLTSALWKDVNKDGSATEEEITKLDIQFYKKMNSQNSFAFYCVPTINCTDHIPAPLIITPAFTYGEEPKTARSLYYFVGDDPEGSSISTAWNAILTDIVKGKTFAESTLLGYTNYFKTIRAEDDDAQALNATRLTFFGLPWYTIDDLIAQPEIQIKSDHFRVMGSEINIPIRNIGDRELIVEIEKNDLLQGITNFVIQPDEIYELKMQINNNTFPIRLNRLPRKSFVKVNLRTNTRKHPNIQLVLEFWQ